MYSSVEYLYIARADKYLILISLGIVRVFSFLICTEGLWEDSFIDAVPVARGRQLAKRIVIISNLTTQNISQ